MSDDVVVRRRADGAVELRVNGVFVMDDAQTSSERLLAEHALAAGAREVLVGGLGLGFTTRQLLAGGVERVVVVELHQEVVDALADDVVVGGRELLADTRLEVVVGDVKEEVVAQPPRTFDAVLLDVDNGPDFLVHPHNAAVYGADFVRACTRVLRPGGSLAVWSMADSPALRAVLAEHLADVAAEPVPVRLQARAEHYWVITGTCVDHAAPGTAPP